MTTSLLDKLVFDSPVDLEHLRPVEPQLLQERYKAAYGIFLDRATRHYAAYTSKFEGCDYRPYQPQYAALICLRRNNILGASMGVGKTIISLLAVQTLYDEPDRRRSFRTGFVHIVVPNLLAATRWTEELERMPGLCGLYTLVKTEADLAAATPILIYTHDFPKLKTSHPRQKLKTKNRIAHYMGRTFQPNFLIVDEVHGLKAGTQRTQYIKYLRDRARRVLVLSGTLSDGNLAQVHHLCNFVYKDRWPYVSPQSFSQLFGQKEKVHTNYLYGSQQTEEVKDKYLQKLDPSKLAIYYQLMRRFIHRVKINEPQISKFITVPAQDVQLHPVQPTAEQIQATQEYIRQHKQALAAASYSRTAAQNAEALKLIHPLIQLANYPAELSNKALKTLEIVENADQKVAVFCSYVGSARYITSFLRNKLQDKGQQVVRLYAQDPLADPKQLSMEQRQETVDAFQYDPAVKVGVFSFNLASEAIDLTRASDVICYCMSWSLIKLLQAPARVVRSGNRNKKVGIHYLFHKGLIDEHQVFLSIEKIKGSKLLLDYELEVEASGSTELTPAEAIRQLLAS